MADCPSFEAVKVDVLMALSHPAIVAHNAHVDLDVLQRQLTGWEPPEVFDTLKLARRLKPGQDSYRLGSLIEAFKLAEGLPEGLTPHRATYDALVAARLFVLLATKAATLEELRGESPEGGEDEAPSLFLTTNAACSSASTGRAAPGSPRSSSTWHNCSSPLAKTCT